MKKRVRRVLSNSSVLRRKGRAQSGNQRKGEAHQEAAVSGIRQIGSPMGSLRAEDLVSLQRRIGNQAVQRMINGGSIGMLPTVSSVPGPAVQRVPEAVKKDNREWFQKQLKTNIEFAMKESEAKFTTTQAQWLANEILQEESLFPPITHAMYDMEKAAFKERADRTQLEMMWKINELQDMLVPYVQRHDWTQKYAKEHRKTIDQRKMLKAYTGDHPDAQDVINGVCFAASIVWLSKVKQSPKLKAQAVMDFINSEAGMQELIRLQRQHHQFIEKQKELPWYQHSAAGLPESEVAALGLRAMEDFVSGSMDELDKLFTWVDGHVSRLDAKDREFRIMLRVYSKKEGGAGHAIAFQFRYIKKIGDDHLQINMLDVNQSLFKMKKLKWGKEKDQQKWKQAISEYLDTYKHKYDIWRLTTYK